ncbi:DUF5071 domain-containing protein [Bacillus sp. JJ722]|uniref:DUF5071 domain-containing protein n=1 Tax=Bacillus sp. JJ722 TaxID=3122973 RepID=UPI002FFF2045
MTALEKLILDLNWHKPDAIQEYAMDELSKLKGKDVVLLAKQSNDLLSKCCWYNASIVLNQIGYPNNQEALPYLMEWFQDTNWPGVDIIIVLLKNIDPSIVKPFIEQGIMRAMEEHDEDWGLGLLWLINDLNMSSLFEDNLIKELKFLANYD